MRLEAFSSAAREEGFCLFANPGCPMGWDFELKAAMEPFGKVAVPEGKHLCAGYAAYANPTLKNQVPDRRFYCYAGWADLKKFKEGGHRASFSSSGRVEASVNRENYKKAIGRIKALLIQGDVYQVNYAIRFRKRISGDPYALFLKWAEKNKAGFSSYLNCGAFQILSLSPERLFRLSGDALMTQPIKGTAAKSGGEAALQGLMTSEKERAELDMITDLERNDIGKVCRFGSVEVKQERAILELPNLWHATSQVEGRLRKGVGVQEVFKALFPGGSVTGCPKERAMQRIEELEKLPRNIFCGSVGYAQGKTADFNIAIRTALVHDGWVEYWAGSGIVMDSDPDREYEECMLKAERFLSLL